LQQRKIKNFQSFFSKLGKNFHVQNYSPPPLKNVKMLTAIIAVKKLH